MIEIGQHVFPKSRQTDRAGKGPCRQRAGEFYESNVYELIVNCATGCFLTRSRLTERRRREE